MKKNEQPIVGSANCGVFYTKEDGALDLPPSRAKKLSIATIAKFNELGKEGYLEIPVDYHEVIKDSEGKVKKRIDAKTGKILTENKKTEKAR